MKKQKYLRMNISYQVEMVNLEELVSKTHQYRRFVKVFDFSEIKQALPSVEKEAVKVYGVFCLFKCLFLQFMKTYRTES